MFHLLSGKSRKGLSRSASALTGVVALVALGSMMSPVQASTEQAGPATAPTAADVCSQAVQPDHAACLALRRTDKFTNRRNAVTPNALPSGYGRADLLSAYNLPATGGSGQTVAIVDAFDDPYAESDLATYRSAYGLPACTTANGCLTKVDQNGGTSYPTADANWSGEISLDLDMVSAICPSCHILLVEAKSTSLADLGTGVNTAVKLGAKFVSNSWGGTENGTEAHYEQYFHHPGVAITAATGDKAYGGGTSYPASSQYVTAVGGTSLSRASNSRGWTESVWKTNTREGAGSGCSTDVPKPSWQHDTGCAKRTVSDVSAVADPATGVAVYQSYVPAGYAPGWTVYGGTSASSPIIASIYALAGTPGVQDTPASYAYAHSANLYDVTTGNNGTCSPTAYFCTAEVGYDGPTGLGTPNGLAAFTATETVTVNSPGTPSGVAGQAFSLQILGSDSFAKALTYSAAGLPAGLSISSSGLISGTASASGTFTVTVTAASGPVSGSATFSLTIGLGGCVGTSSPALAAGAALVPNGFGTTQAAGVTPTLDVKTCRNPVYTFRAHTTPTHAG